MRLFRQDSQRRRGPGLPESCLWAAGYLLAQLVGLCLFLAIFTLAAFDGWPQATSQIVDLAIDMELDRSFVPLGVANLLCLFILIPAVFFRMGRSARHELKLTAPRRNQVVLIAGSILPLAIVSEQLYRWSFSLWATAAQIWPSAQALSRSNAVDGMVQFARSEPFSILIVAIALGPAVGEELVFRGLIGNGLVRRWGVRAGMLLTSILFATAHGFPPHAIATIPIGLFLHHVYLSTGTLWASILVHFLNNLLMITLARYSLIEGLPCSPLVLICSAAYVATTAGILGRDLPRSHTDAQAPSAGFASRLRLEWRRPVLAAGIVVSFTAAFVWTAIAGN